MFHTDRSKLPNQSDWLMVTIFWGNYVIFKNQYKYKLAHKSLAFLWIDWDKICEYKPKDPRTMILHVLGLSQDRLLTELLLLLLLAVYIVLKKLYRNINI